VLAEIAERYRRQLVIARELGSEFVQDPSPDATNRKLYGLICRAEGVDPII
jgi:hypothetical protein